METKDCLLRILTGLTTTYLAYNLIYKKGLPTRPPTEPVISASVQCIRCTT